MNEEMVPRIVNIILIIFAVECFSFLDGKRLDPANHPQQWQDLISFVYQKIDGMERLLAEKDVIIGKLVERVSHLESTVMLNTISDNSATRHHTMSNIDLPASDDDFSDQIRPPLNNDTIQRDGVTSVQAIQNKPHGNLIREKTTPFSESSLANTVDLKRHPIDASSKNSHPVTFASQHLTKKDQPIYQADQNQESVDLPKAKLTQSRVAPSSPRRAVAFHAELSKDKFFSDNEIIAYDQEKLDQGDGYIQGVGLYIVPESGTYVITWTTVCDVQTILQTVLVVNGVIRGYSWTDSEEINDRHQTSAIVVLALNEGDHVFVRMEYAHGNRQMISRNATAWSTFSGWKLD